MPSQLQPSASPLTGARQTMMSWARVVESSEAVPQVFQAAYQALLQDGPASYTVLAPPQAGARGHKPVERLLCGAADRLYVLEPDGGQVTTTAFCYADICSFEVGNILLYSWFSIHSQTVTGSQAAVTVAFNEATRRHFEPFFKKMRPAPSGIDPIALALEREKLDGLASENFKFMNFGCDCLVPGEQVLQLVYQPPNRQPLVSLLGRSLYRTLFLAHLTILTDKEVILISDAEGVTEKERGKYGGVQRYLPLPRLASVTLEQTPNDLLLLTFHAGRDVLVKKLFALACRPELEQFQQTLAARLG